MANAEEPTPTRALRDLNHSYFPFTPVAGEVSWKARQEEIKRRLLVAAGLYPMPAKTPLKAVMHGRIVLDDYTVDKVYFESLPGHFVTGNLYLPRFIQGQIPAIICPHGHWPNGRFMNADDAEVKKQIEMGAEKLANAAHSPLQARCVQLARMGCAVFFYDMLGYADSVQFPEHRHGPAAKGFVSTDAELNLVSYFGLQTWNSERVVDFLSSLPYVDTSRIGCTGASGGGTQTMMIAGIDDRIAAAFPCVMVSTAMQGGCTCENAHYLRINQGNIDIAAVTAPQPLGMTAADDWTKELETKGFPDLQKLYAMLGVPDRVEAHFNIKFPHNYNAVSRAQMYEFFNRHFKLDWAGSTEHDFRLLSTTELSVWDDNHPKPSGDQMGQPHEIAVANWFKQQAAMQIRPLLDPKYSTAFHQRQQVLANALEVIIGRNLPGIGQSVFTLRTEDNKGGVQVERGTTTCRGDTIETTFLYPAKWNRQTILWLTFKGEGSIIDSEGRPSNAAEAILNRGFAIACPKLYLLEATRNPTVNPSDKRTYEGFSGFHYGYNPSLFAERVRDALALIAQIRDNQKYPTRKIFVAGVEGAGIVAAAATALSRDAVQRLACDTEGFRFAKLENVWDVNFVPGAEKYGDVPAILSLCASVPTTVFNETTDTAPAAASTFAATKGKLELAGAPTSAAAVAVARALAGGR